MGSQASTFRVTLDSVEITSTLPSDAPLRESWQPPKATPGFDGEQIGYECESCVRNSRNAHECMRQAKSPLRHFARVGTPDLTMLARHVACDGAHHPMRSIVASVLSLSLAACVADSGPTNSDDGGGKADDNDACTASYIEWLVTTYKVEVEASPLDATRLAALEALALTAPCRTELLGGAALDSWLDVGNAVSFLPYFQQHAAAAEEFQLAGENAGVYGGYLTSTAVTDQTKFATKAMLAARPKISAGAFEMQAWFDFYAVHLENVLTPLWDRALQTEIENAWILNAGESEFLDLVQQTKPTTVRDGAFGAWVRSYDELLRNGSQAADTSDDYRAVDANLGCLAWEGTPLVGTIPTITEPCQRNTVLDRFKALKPNAFGEADSEQWMGTLWLWATLAATSDPTTSTNDLAQLARINDVKPFRVKGVAAYKLWLEIISDAASNMAVLDGTVLPAEACAGPEADELYVGFLQGHLALPAYVISRAAPNACP